ncbi:hypothetical protein D9758_012686 [Tetrapyrgos nigripes]|uniref:ATP-dependent DNA helicase n=1 Tax=Tetrapyrgos nigripes TaxID=182062 RepID=A0A8H5CVZ8_9AGAR|nr:hypothetical protein D9758_012686 [Tetrapyrgos nigripes]
MRRLGGALSATLLMCYLDQPQHPFLDSMTYLEFSARCNIVTHDPVQPVTDCEIVENIVPNRTQMRIWLLAESHRRVVRIVMVYPRHGDVFYLCCLLMHGGAFHSWEDICTVDGVLYDSFADAARAKGLFDNASEGTLAFQELVEVGASPGQLRWLFCVLAVEGKIVSLLTHPDENAVHNEALLLLQQLLCGLGKCLSDFNLPEPQLHQTEVDAEQMRWNGDPHNLSGFLNSLTVEQRQIYNCIIAALSRTGEIILLSASSAFAAKNYPGVKHGGSHAQLLLAAKCHVIDEICGLHFKAFNCADRLMRSLTGNLQNVWGGRLLITLGDFRQVAPVVRFGGQTAITKASICTQPVFHKFEVHELTQNLCQSADAPFAQFLDSIGDNTSANCIDLSPIRSTSSVEEATLFAFPDSVLADPHQCTTRTYYSCDSAHTEDDTQSREQEAVTTVDFLNSLKEPGVPAHELNLKVGAIACFTQNFDPSKGLMKNTQVIVHSLLRHSVEVETIPEIIGGRHARSECFHVPRINVQFTPSGFNFVVNRKQILLVLAYSTTFNGCQGLTVLNGEPIIIMSSQTVLTLATLSLINGQKEAVNGKPMFVYNTLFGLDTSARDALYHTYMRPGTSFHVDNSCVTVLAKANIPPNPGLPIILEGIVELLHPGVPTNDGYQDSIPVMEAPFIIATGNVLQTTSNNDGKVFAMSTTEYMGGNTVSYTLHSMYDPIHSRWKNTSLLHLGNHVFVIGQAVDFNANNVLTLNVEHIVLNLAGGGTSTSALPTPAPSAPTSDDDGPPTRKRRYNARQTGTRSNALTIVADESSINQVSSAGSMVDTASQEVDMSVVTTAASSGHEEHAIQPYISEAEAARRFFAALPAQHIAELMAMFTLNAGAVTGPNNTQQTIPAVPTQYGTPEQNVESAMMALATRAPSVGIQIQDQTEKGSAKWPIFFRVSDHNVYGKLCVMFAEDVTRNWVTVSCEMILDICAWLNDPSIPDLTLVKCLAKVLTPMTFMYAPYLEHVLPSYSGLHCLMLYPAVLEDQKVVTNIRISFMLEVTSGEAVHQFVDFLLGLVDCVRTDSPQQFPMVSNLSYACGFSNIFGFVDFMGLWTDLLIREGNMDTALPELVYGQ